MSCCRASSKFLSCVHLHERGHQPIQLTFWSLSKILRRSWTSLRQFSELVELRRRGWLELTSSWMLLSLVLIIIILHWSMCLHSIDPPPLIWNFNRYCFRPTAAQAVAMPGYAMSSVCNFTLSDAHHKQVECHAATRYCFSCFVFVLPIWSSLCVTPSQKSIYSYDTYVRRTRAHTRRQKQKTKSHPLVADARACAALHNSDMFLPGGNNRKRWYVNGPSDGWKGRAGQEKNNNLYHLRQRPQATLTYLEKLATKMLHYFRGWWSRFSCSKWTNNANQTPHAWRIRPGQP